MQELLEFRCVRPLRTVHQLLQDAHGLALLSGAPCLQQRSCWKASIGFACSMLQKCPAPFSGMC